MRQIPTNYICTQSSPIFTAHTAPAGIFQKHLDHGTDQRVLPRVSVLSGSLYYKRYENEADQFPVEVRTVVEGMFTVVDPEVWHHLEIIAEDTTFQVDFYVDPELLAEKTLKPETYTVTVTNNTNGVSVDRDTDNPKELLVPENGAALIRDLVNVVRGYDSEEDCNVCGW